MNWFRSVLLSLLTAGLFVLLNYKHDGDIPPPGKFFNPFTGFWQNNVSTDELPGRPGLRGLHEAVRIVWDDRRVPHVFAANTHDLFFAQGYCTARDRLWQMDFQARAAAGRLSEVAGARTLETDRFHRRIGLNLAAELAARNILADPFLSDAIEAFCAGVNAWINDLDERHLPVEFKILDYQPGKWTPLKTALILSNFSRTLSFSSTDAALTNVRDILGDSVVSMLYPDVLPFMDPIIPPGTRWGFVPEAVHSPGEKKTPKEQDQVGRVAERAAQRVVSDRQEVQAEQEVFKGSNNWAVSGTRTAHGRPILCNDPHLSLTLPSIWYEIQLASPEMNVYGVSSPGAPGVLIGFNKRIAFGETNAGSDAIDWYRITFKDSSLNAYLHDTRWRPTSKRIEVITVRGAATVRDTIVHTHHGPVVAGPGRRSTDRRIPTGCAMRWIALDSTNTPDTFLKINMAGTYDEFVRALEGFHGPAQNFAYADVDNNIAIWHNGKLPLRPEERGKFVCDGTDPAHEWQGWVPHAHLPHVLNPSRGFVSSANQPPADSTYPYYLGWTYAGFERSTRINDRLRSLEKATIEDMMALQKDIVNPRAAKALPVLLPLIEEHSLNPDEAKAFNELKYWKSDYDTSLIAPQVFEYWWVEIHKNIWQDDFHPKGVPLLQPGADVTLRLLLSDPRSPFIDNRDTPVIESLEQTAQESFPAAVRGLTKDLGPFGAGWSWGTSRGTNIRHLAQLPGLGRSMLQTAGNNTTVNAITRGGGPSWRMVIDMTSPPKGWGVYPGGQSGNPGSAFYDNFVEDWLRGEYYDLVFLNTPEEMNRHIIGTTILMVTQ
jgi:penicillin amidase